MEQRKNLDQYRTSGIVSTRDIQRFKRYQIRKSFNQRLQRKISKSETLTSRLVRGVDGAALYRQDPAKESEYIDF